MKNKLKKILIPGLIATIAMLFFAVFTAQAMGIGDWFSFGDQDNISFTQYAGQLAEIESTVGDVSYDSALTPTGGDLKAFIIRIVNFALGFLGLIAVIIVIYGGVLYVTAGGEEEKTQTAKKAITYATIGLLIVMGSFAFVNTIIRGAGGETDPSRRIDGRMSATSFNASSEQLRFLAKEIYDGYVQLTDTSAEIEFIINDAEKASLDPYNLPPKGDVLAFLNSVQNKLKNIKNKVNPLSQTQIIVDEMIKENSKEIDFINTLNQKKYVKFDDKVIKYCNPDDYDWVDFAYDISPSSDKNDTPQERCYNDGYKNAYIKGLFEEWRYIRSKYMGESILPMTSHTSAINEILSFDELNSFKYKPETLYEPISLDYALRLKEAFTQIHSIFMNNINIDALAGQNSLGRSTYLKLAQNYGYLPAGASDTIASDLDPQSWRTKQEVKVLKAYGGLLKEIYDWGINPEQIKEKQIVTAGYLERGLSAHEELYEIFKNLKYVDARLSADVVEGSAPLTVTFDIFGSVDPAGGSIRGDNIIWDVAGQNTIEDLINKTETDTNLIDTIVDKESGEIVISEEDIQCEFVQPEDQEKLIGKTAQRCTYHKPGTYTVAVKINSNSATKFAPGISLLTIKVRPPTNKIDLTIKAKSGEAQTVSRYEDDVRLVDKRIISFTSDEAKNGLTFDASATGAERYKWDFGNGQIVDYGEAGENGVEEVKYRNPGRYQVTLTVLNSLGIEDRKTFTLEVSDLVSRIKADPENKAYVGQTVRFDGSGSRAQNGQIRGYLWAITPDFEQYPHLTPEIKNTIKKDFDTLNGLLPETDEQITYQFKYPMSYTVKLGVVSETVGTPVETYIRNYRVVSKPPVAQFTYDNPDTAYPGRYILDASSSFDPDGDFDLRYEWTIEPLLGGSYKWITENSNKEEKPEVEFSEKGDYKVSLKAIDPIALNEIGTISKTIKIRSVLGLSLNADDFAKQLNDEGQATISFTITSNKGKEYEIDFGDGEKESGLLTGGSETITHSYNYAEKFTVTATVFDEDENGNSLSRNVYIEDGKRPIANAAVYVNGVRVPDQDIDNVIRVSRADTLTFDATDSINLDGTAKKLNYSWDFGDSDKSSSKVATHVYKDLSPRTTGFYEISLVVFDSDDPSLTSRTQKINISVDNEIPKYSAILAVPAKPNEPVTPVLVNLTAQGANDPDGKIIQYKWWYFDKDDPDEPLGIQITTSPNAQMTIGTNGAQDKVMTYYFGLEVTDSDNATNRYISPFDIVKQENAAQITVKNGPNELPTAKFNVDITSAFTGDEIRFTSASTDSDGQIVKYYWDLEGDGFYNNLPVTESSIVHKYTARNLEGYDVRLKVVDDKGGESVSQPIKIYIDSLAEPPIAAFKTELIPGSKGKKLKFINNSRADESAGAEIISYKWDFDIDSSLDSADSDGDGRKDNDTDSQATSPERLYTQYGTYNVKLTVLDNQGNSGEVINTVKIPMAEPPTAAFIYKVENDGKIRFINNSTADTASEAQIKQYIWDFNIALDSDGDGNPANDKDSVQKEPVVAFENVGTYQVKLTVIDDQEGRSEVVNTVNVTQQINPSLPITPNAPTIPLKAVFTTDPLPGLDGVVTLTGNEGRVKFNYSASEGDIAYYIFDKNIYFDTDGNGIKDDDEDFKTSLSGSWTTTFMKEWGKTVVKLKIIDNYGNENSVQQEISFQ